MCSGTYVCTGLCKISYLLDKSLTSFKIWEKLRCKLELDYSFFFPDLNTYYLYPIAEENPKTLFGNIQFIAIDFWGGIFLSPFVYDDLYFNDYIVSDPEWILKHP